MNSNEEFVSEKRTAIHFHKKRNDDEWNKLMTRFDMVYWTLNLVLITRLPSYTITKTPLYFYSTP
jgi:hypothetical protein